MFKHFCGEKKKDLALDFASTLLLFHSLWDIGYGGTKPSTVQILYQSRSDSIGDGVKVVLALYAWVVFRQTALQESNLAQCCALNPHVSATVGSSKKLFEVKVLLRSECFEFFFSTAF